MDRCSCRKSRNKATCAPAKNLRICKVANLTIGSVMFVEQKCTAELHHPVKSTNDLYTLHVLGVFRIVVVYWNLNHF